jgi:hypothetical protein
MRTGLLTTALLALRFDAPEDYTELIAVEAGYAIVTTAAQVLEEAKKECCSDCKGKGYVVQNDGHNTLCICPDTCACKKGFKK